MLPVSRIQLSASGPTCSRFALGLWRLAAWNLSPEKRLDLIHRCLDRGLTTFDHADIYGDYRCEQLFGEATARLPGLRERMELVTKCGIRLVSERRPAHRIKHYDTSRAHIVTSVENSLRALVTDRIDLLLLHRPDPLMDPHEVAEAFVSLHEAGKVHFFGASNFTPSQFALLDSVLPFPLVTNQIECSLLHVEPLSDGTLDQSQRLRRAPMAWSPLGGGRLFTGEDEQARRVRETLRTIGDELGGASADQVALAWLLRHPARIVPILGSGTWERIESALGAEQLELSREQWFALLRAATGHDVA